MSQTAPSRPRLVRRTQRERRETSYRRMLDAAVKLIERQGSSRTTLAQIGELSGYSYGLVSHRFGSKEALVRAVTRERSQILRGMKWVRSIACSGSNALVTLVERYLRAAAIAQSQCVLVLIGEALGPVPEIRPTWPAADAELSPRDSRLIEQGIEAGEIRPRCGSRCTGRDVVGTLRGLASSAFRSVGVRPGSGVPRELGANVDSKRSPARSPQGKPCAMLSDIRVLEISAPETMQAGSILAALGADVVVVEPLTGSAGRRMEPFLDEIPGLERSLTWHALNRNKRGITLDMHSVDSRELLARSAREVRYRDSIPSTSNGVAPLDDFTIPEKLVRIRIAPFGQQWSEERLCIVGSDGDGGERCARRHRRSRSRRRSFFRCRRR